MANQLKMATVNAIQMLKARGWSNRRIAREMGVHRETVQRYVRLGNSKPANAPTGSDGQNRPNAPTGSEAQNRPNALTGSSGPRSGCEPYRDTIISKLDQGLTATRIHQDLVADHDCELSYHSVRRFCAKLRAARPLPFRRLECAPGQEAQVDFGKGAPVIQPDGRRRRTWVFRIVLSHSRKGYTEVVYRQTTDAFIRCLENAFWHFGGVPRTLVIDNLKAAVTRADWYDPELNPKLVSFSQHYGVAILPTKPYTPRHKGKVERGVGYVQDNGLKRRTFNSLCEQNDHLRSWEAHIADTRIHGTTRQQVRQRFEEAEKAALQPLPVERFPSFHEGERTVHRDGHVEVQRAYYSVPPEYLGRVLWVRWDERIVRVFDRDMQPVAMHVRSERGHFSTKPEHIASEKIATVERGTDWLLQRASRIGRHTECWAHTLIERRGIEGTRVLVGLLSLAKDHRSRVIDTACEVAHSHGDYRLKTLRKLIKNHGPMQDRFEFIQEHPLIRDLEDYGHLVEEVCQ